MTNPTPPHPHPASHVASEPVASRRQNSDDGLSAEQILGRLSVADMDLPNDVMAILAEKIQEMTHGNFQAVEAYVDHLESAINLAKPDKVIETIAGLAWIPEDAREVIETKIRARHERERQHSIMEVGMQELAHKQESKRDFVRRVLVYLQTKFQGMMQSSALKAAREAGQALFLSGVVNDPSQVMTITEQQEIGPSVTPGMAVGRGKAQAQGGMMRQIPKRK